MFAPGAEEVGEAGKNVRHSGCSCLPGDPMEPKKAAADVRVMTAAAILSEPAAEATAGAADEPALDRLIVNGLTRCCHGIIGKARRTRRHAMVVAAVVLSCAAAHAQPRVTFSRVTTDPGLGRFDFVSRSQIFSGKAACGGHLGSASITRNRRRRGEVGAGGRP